MRVRSSMWSRRSFVAALLVALPLPALGDKSAPTWWLGENVLKAGKGTITVMRSGNRPTPSKLKTRVTPRSIDITSVKNDNTEFTMWVVFPKQADTDVFLFAQGVYIQSDSYGHDETGSQASFQLDRPTAERLAKLLNVPLNERAPIGTGLQATWTFPPRARITKDDPIPIKLRVKNAGTTTVGFVIGGRQRGARDNRFTFSVSRNGTPVTIKDAPDFGGLMYYKALKPGEEYELTVDLRSWADLDAPGHYQIDARYEGELAKDGVMPSTAADRKNLWDLALVGQGGILVQ